MPREAYEFFGSCSLKDICHLIWCPPSLFGANIWSCCGALPPSGYLWQMLALWFGNMLHKDLPQGHQLSEISVLTYGAGGKLDD
jgi:hypothetical protein